MALWRPLLEGLAVGIRSSARSSAGGVGCLLQRSSVLAFRSILLRHGHLFSTPQWAAILGQTLIPCIRAGAQADVSPVVRITSESPSVSNIDFLVESLPLPPAPDDDTLASFKEMNPSAVRSIGHAELMLEASFSDLRHGGDGDLRKSYKLAKKDSPNTIAAEQPFPDSWVATTAPIALGLVTDVASETVVHRGAEGLRSLWPLIGSLYRSWCVGYERVNGSSDGTAALWRPCEAIVRIACKEVWRLSVRLSDAITRLPPADRVSWSSAILDLYSDLLSENVRREKSTEDELSLSKNKALVDKKTEDFDGDELDDVKEVVITPYGTGTVTSRKRTSLRAPEGRKDRKLVTSTIKLDFGTLYQPVIESKRRKTPIPVEVSSKLKS